MPSPESTYQIRRSLVEGNPCDVITSRVLACGVVRLGQAGVYEMLHRLDAGVTIRMMYSETLMADVIGTAIAAMPVRARTRVLREAGCLEDGRGKMEDGDSPSTASAASASSGQACSGRLRKAQTEGRS